MLSVPGHLLQCTSTNSLIITVHLDWECHRVCLWCLPEEIKHEKLRNAILYDISYISNMGVSLRAYEAADCN